MAPRLEVSDLVVSYGPRTVLDGMRLTVEAGEIVAVLGPTGCGKTTLLRAISGVATPGSGRILLDGRPISELSRRELSRSVAVLAQSPTLPAGFTVEEVTLMGRTPHLGFFAQEGPDDYRRTRAALEMVGAAALASRTVDQLSGGERQKVALARCLAQDAPVLLLDEPTAHLDIGHQIAVAHLVQNLARDRQLAVLAAIHDLTLAAFYCDRVVMIHAGRPLAEGSPADVLTEDNLARVFGTSVRILRDPSIPGPIVAPLSVGETAVHVGATASANGGATPPAGGGDAEGAPRSTLPRKPAMMAGWLQAIAGEPSMAIKILSRFPSPTFSYRGTGAAAFGIIGGALGLTASIPMVVLGSRQPLLAAALSIAVLALISGALHLDGLADTADALVAVGRDAAERARKDPRVGPAGASALVLVLAIDIICLGALVHTSAAVWSLVVATATSRAVTAVAAPWLRSTGRGFGAWFARGTSPAAAIVAAITTVLLSLPGGRVAWSGLAVGAAVGVGSLVFFQRRFDAISGDAFGAAIELSFAAALVAEVIAA